jgi:DDE superfamily endonuclease
MMVAVALADADEGVGVDPPAVVRERLEAFAEEVLAEAVNRPVQMVNGALYLRGLIEQGERKSLEPIVERLGEEADYHSMQQFLADSRELYPEVVDACEEEGGVPSRLIKNNFWV